MTERELMVLRKTVTSYGLHSDLYVKEWWSLERAGLVESRVTFTKAGGNRVNRVFITDAGRAALATCQFEAAQ